MRAGTTVSIVVPTLGRPRMASSLARRLAALCPPPNEILVVFQRRSELDDVEDELEAAGATGLLCPATSAAAARNWGMHAATGDVVVFLDDDCTPVRSDHLSRLVAALGRVPEPVLVTGPVLGWAVGRRGPRWLSSHATWIVPILLHPVGHPANTSATHAATVWGGNFAGYRRELVSMGGFDERFTSPSLYEETELSIRARRLKEGAAIAYVPEAPVVHEQAPRGGQRDQLDSFDPFVLGEQKGRLLRLVRGPEGGFRLNVGLVCNLLVFGSVWLRRAGVRALREYRRGLWTGSRRTEPADVSSKICR